MNELGQINPWHITWCSYTFMLATHRYELKLLHPNKALLVLPVLHSLPCTIKHVNSTFAQREQTYTANSLWVLWKASGLHEVVLVHTQSWLACHSTYYAQSCSTLEYPTTLNISEVQFRRDGMHNREGEIHKLTVTTFCKKNKNCCILFYVSLQHIK